MKIEIRQLSELKRYENNPRLNAEAVDVVAQSILDYGFNVPLGIDKDDVIVTGDTRYQALLKLGWTEARCVVLDHLNAEEIKAFRIADNKVAEFSQWDDDKLAAELRLLEGSEFKFDTFLDDNAIRVLEPSKVTQAMVDRVADKESTKYEDAASAVQDEMRKVTCKSCSKAFSVRVRDLEIYVTGRK